MKDQILSNLHDPGQLEKLYRADKASFKRAFNGLYPNFSDNTLAGYWHQRLNFATEEISWGTNKELLFVVLASVLAGIVAKLPAFLPVSEEFFYPRNLGFIVFPALTAYFAWKNRIAARTNAFIVGASLVGLVFINSLPAIDHSDTTVLACLHLLLFLWSLLGLAFVGEQRDNPEARLSYLRFNGDLIVITTLILIAGGIMSGITIGLFSLIGYHIEEFYFRNVAIFGLAAAPVVGTYLSHTNPHLVGKVSPVIAKLFGPLVLVMLVVYLVAMGYSGKDPFNDREFLLIFNALLVGVMAIIFFSVAETANTTISQTETWVLFLLSAITIVVNGIALAAILFRISEWGITPNRAAVMGGNILILFNLLMVTGQLYKAVSKKADVAEVGNAIAYFLPVYCLWTVLVTFLFPLLFGFS